MSAANEKIIRDLEATWNSNQLDKIDAFFAPSFVQHSALPGVTPTLETAKQAHQFAMAAMPDRNTEIQEMVSNDDKVVARIRITGTNTGGFPPFNIPANGNKADFEWISIYTLKDGKVTEHRAIIDVATFMQQMGAQR